MILKDQLAKRKENTMWDQNKEKLGVTGHRGCKDYMPENTLISFREAFKLGVDVLEFDIQFTRDDAISPPTIPMI